ncbi:MAG TPA: tRNA threonylcarbamoyladenosine dehydratase [Firmicutes bacterium]|nr:tRNA threonylcarbamoyladenosine dehydratase [Bacillota bacterium]
MQSQFSRTELLLGEDALRTLSKKRVAVFGIGGVGGNAAEALARSGIGELDLIDNDEVCLSNINRQVFATLDAVGEKKVDAAERRLAGISQELVVHKHCCFYLPEERGDIDFSQFDYVVDALDTVSAKIDIVLQAKRAGIPVISALGCGNRTDPSKLKVCDISETSGDPLARVVRRELRKRGVFSLKVVFSEELPVRPLGLDQIDSEGEKPRRKSPPGSTAFVPPVAGILIAHQVVMDLTSWTKEGRSMPSKQALEALEEERKTFSKGQKRVG